MAPHSSILAWKIHGWRSLVGCSPWGREESDTTERLHCHFSLSCTGEGNGNPLQCSCLENPRDGGAWWAAVYGVTQSRTQLKWLSSSSKILSCQRSTYGPFVVFYFVTLHLQFSNQSPRCSGVNSRKQAQAYTFMELTFNQETGGEQKVEEW